VIDALDHLILRASFRAGAVGAAEGDTVTVKLARGGKEMVFPGVVLSGQVAAYGQAFLGAGEDAQAQGIGCQCEGADRRVVRTPAAQGGFVGELGDPPAATAFHAGRCQRAELDPVEHGGQRLTGAGSIADDACPGRLHEQLARLAGFFHADRQHAGAAFLPDDAGGVGRDQAGVERGVRAADGRVPGEGNFLGGRKDAGPVVRTFGARGHQEGGFDQVGPVGEALHALVGPAFCVDDDTQGITAAVTGGEDVELLVTDGGHRSCRERGRSVMIAVHRLSGMARGVRHRRALPPRCALARS